MAARRFGDPVHLAWAAHGLDFLGRRHRQPAGGYAWVLDGSGVRDAMNHCYGLAFVMVAGATALLAGLPPGLATLERAWDLLEAHFLVAPFGLSKDEPSADFPAIAPYRRRKANIHLFEALLWTLDAHAEQ